MHKKYQIIKLLNKSEGFALVEIIVSITLLLIIITAYTSLFTTSFSGIFAAGHKSNATYEMQTDMEKAIAEHNIILVDVTTANSASGNIITTTVEDSPDFSIVFNSGTVSVDGKYISKEVKYNVEGHERTVSTASFVPD